ncbi:hypothetical protein [Bacillus sp. V2I10]|uniref:hypothetical protein n=1 Tax=Bacillus sp. V2I10 TaxID=3042276 RepID=UPI00278443EA|nr:hypothetical protein [Bacillus sp. V2I10]MDQ0861938.1 hypothetical protein [Bacillus sp. V2I10]
MKPNKETVRKEIYIEYSTETLFSFFIKPGKNGAMDGTANSARTEDLWEKQNRY